MYRKSTRAMTNVRASRFSDADAVAGIVIVVYKKGIGMRRSRLERPARLRPASTRGSWWTNGPIWDARCPS